MVRSLLALLPLMALAGCAALTFPIHTSSRDDEPEPMDTAWDTALELWAFGYLGEAEVVSGESWTGWEEFIIRVVGTEQHICRYHWEATGEVTDPCPACVWAFDVTLQQGEQTEGDCAGMDLQPTSGPWRYGFSYVYAGPYYMYYDVLWIHYQGYGWAPWQVSYWDQGIVQYASISYAYY